MSTMYVVASIFERMRMNFGELLKGCESEIEAHLLHALYPELGSDSQENLRSQHVIDYYNMPITIPDLAFPEDKIAVYCDGYKYHSNLDSFQKDRKQSRELQLQGWFVLRFSGSEILNDTDTVILTIQQAIRKKEIQKANQQALLLMKWKKRSVWGGIAAILIAAVVGMILFEYFFPTLFFELF